MHTCEQVTTVGESHIDPPFLNLLKRIAYQFIRVGSDLFPFFLARDLGSLGLWKALMTN